MKRNSNYPSVFGSPVRFDRIWNEFFNADMPSNFYTGAALPAVNVSEKDDAYSIEVVAPGFSKKDFSISLDNGVLTVEARRESDEDKSGHQYTRREYSYAGVKRSFTVPETVSPDAIRADYRDGVLHLELPKREEAKAQPAREIKVS